MDKDKMLSLFLERERMTYDAKNFLDCHTDANGQLSQSDADTFNRMADKCDALKSQIQAELSKPSTPRIYDAIGYGYGDGTDTGGFKMAGITGTKEYKKNFFAAMRARFVDSVKNSYLREGDAASGGYLCPDELNDSIIAKLQDENVIRQIGRTIATSNTLRIPLVASSPTAMWVAEGGQINFTDGAFSQVYLDAHKIVAATKISSELLADAGYDMQGFLIDEFSKSLGATEEMAFINGKREDGQPTGFLTTLADVPDSTITTKTKEVTADDLISLIYSLRRPYRRNAKFLCADSMLAQIRKLKDSTQNYIWQPSLQESEPPRIFGVPVYTSNAMPADTVAYGDFSYFVIADRGGRTVKGLYELFAAQDIVGFMLIQRVDGLLVDTEAIRLLKLKS